MNQIAVRSTMIVDGAASQLYYASWDPAQSFNITTTANPGTIIISAFDTPDFNSDSNLHNPILYTIWGRISLPSGATAPERLILNIQAYKSGAWVDMDAGGQYVFKTLPVAMAGLTDCFTLQWVGQLTSPHLRVQHRLRAYLDNNSPYGGSLVTVSLVEMSCQQVNMA